jgi:hypothetical protein
LWSIAYKMITEALVVPEPGAAFSFEKVNVDENLRDNELLVEMKATGVCHTDLNFSKEKSIPGLFPAVFGHEGEHAREYDKLSANVARQNCFIFAASSIGFQYQIPSPAICCPGISPYHQD